MKTVRKNVSARSFQKNGLSITEYITPAGTLTSARKYCADSSSWRLVEFPVKRREDIQVMSLFYSEATCEFDSDQFDQASAAMRRIGEDGIVSADIGVSPLMNWIQYLAGVENAEEFLQLLEEKGV